MIIFIHKEFYLKQFLFSFFSYNEIELKKKRLIFIIYLGNRVIESCSSM